VDLDRESLNALPAVPMAEVADEAAHFHLCPGCGQAVDQRKLGDVIHHMTRGHAPLPLNG
jgi:hypothetical protein